MINIGTFIKITDNSGALLGCCLNRMGFSKKNGVLSGQTLIVNIKKAIFKKHIVKKSKIIKKSQICKALLIRSIRGIKRWGNFIHKCGSNAAILVNQYDIPYATRLLGIMFREVRTKLIYRKLVGVAEFLI
jgi:large subunit ribosomal protein L14